MILSDKDIKKYIEKGIIVIRPKPNYTIQLGACSLDLHMGKDVKIFRYTECPFIDLKDQKSIESIMADVEISDQKPFVLRPRDFILAITEEYIELPNYLMGRLDGRSSLGRLGLVVHSTAARFDPGWKGKAVMEIGNMGIIPIILYPGIRICSLTFETLTNPVEVPYTKQPDHKYAGQTTPLASRLDKELERQGRLELIDWSGRRIFDVKKKK